MLILPVFCVKPRMRWLDDKIQSCHVLHMNDPRDAPRVFRLCIKMENIVLTNTKIYDIIFIHTMLRTKGECHYSVDTKITGVSR
jgi:hypothetical protein